MTINANPADHIEAVRVAEESPVEAPTQRFHEGDRVIPSDRENIGTVIHADCGNGRVLVQFVNPDTGNTAEKPFPTSELRLASDSDSGATGEHGPEALAAAFEVHYLNPPEPAVERPPSFIEGILSHGYTNLSSPPKVGKTLVGLFLALCIQTGAAFFGRRVNAAPCAWLQLDMPEYAFQEYANWIGKGMGIPAEGRHHQIPYFASSWIDLSETSQQDALIEKLKELGTKLLFIDSSRAASSVDEDKSAEVRTFVRGFLLERLRNELGISCVVIAHNAKNGSGPRGSGEWAAAADSLWSLSSEDGVITIDGTGRHAPFKLQLELEIDEERGTAVFREVDGDKRLEERLQVARGEALLATNAKPLTKRRLENALKDAGLGVRNRASGDLLKELVARYPDEFRLEPRKYGQYVSEVVVPALGDQSARSIEDKPI